MIGKLKEIFTFNKGDRRGVFVLLIIIIAVITAMSFDLHLLAEEPFDISIYEKDIEELLAIQEKVSVGYAKPTYLSIIDTAELIAFDPNTVSLEQLRKFGICEKLLNTINNYRTKGGMFRDKQNFKNIYGVNDDLFKTLEDYIEIKIIPSKQNVYPKYNKYKKREYKEYPKTDYNIIVDINSADTTELKKIRGIGSFFAKEIIKEREKLGGFHSKQQLLEVYNIDEEKLKAIENSIKIDTLLVKGLNINKLTAKELANHPYLNYFQAKSILSYREMAGEIKNIEELLQNKVLGEGDFNKVRHYLTK